MPMDRGTTILVVDDQPMVAEMAAAILERRGYSALIANSAAEALEMVERRGREIALLLTDVVIPGMDGFGLANRIAAMRPDLPVIFMSGALLADQEPRYSPFLRKPFRPEELVQCVRSSLDSRGRSD